MIRGLRRNLLSVRYEYENPIERQRAQGLLYVCLSFLLAWAVWNGFQLFMELAQQNVLLNVEFSDVRLFQGPPLMVPLLVGGIMFALQTGRLLVASVALVGVLLLVFVLGIFSSGVDTPALITAFLSLTAAGLLLKRDGVLLTFGLLVAGLLLVVFPATLAVTDLLTAEILVPLLIMFIVTGFFIAMGGYAEQVVDEIVADVDQFQAISRFSAQVAHTDESSIYQGAIRLIRGELMYSYAQFFLADESGRFNQRISTGASSGQRTTAAIGDASALLEALRSREPVIVSTYDNVMRRAHFLPSTLYGLAVPLIDGERVIGVLDVQDNTVPFTTTRIAALVTLSEQMVALLRDVNQITALKEDLRQQQQTGEYMRDRLRELRRDEQGGVAAMWDDYVADRGVQVVGFDLDAADAIPVPARDLPEIMQRAGDLNDDYQIEQVGDEQRVVVPIKLRGETLGAMAFTIPPGQNVSEKQVAMARNVAFRLATALENKRLFEQSQAQASRERKANEIASTLIGATEVDTVLSLAADNFNEALGAVRTRIHLQPGVLADRSARPAQNGHSEDNGGPSR